MTMTWRPISELTDEIWDDDPSNVILGNSCNGPYHPEPFGHEWMKTAAQHRTEGCWTCFIHLPPIEGAGSAE